MTRREPVTTSLAELRYALRTLARRPAFTLTAVVTLALGIGANATIFSVVNALLLRPLPYPDADRLVAIWSENPERGWSRTDVPLPDAWDWKSRTTALEDLAVYDRGTFNLTGVERPERLLGSRTTTNLFSLFGVEPRHGRTFLVEDGRPGAEPVAVLSHAFCERRFGGAASVLGSSLQLDGEPHTVVGVMGPDFLPPDVSPDVWVPYRMHPRDGRRGAHSQVAVGRLRPGVSIVEADRAVAQVALALQEEFPDTNRGWTASVRSLHDPDQPLHSIVTMSQVIDRQVSSFSLIATLMGIFALVSLALGAVGLYGVTAYGVVRRRNEIGIRMALGARRRDVQLMVVGEGLARTLIGLVLGLALALLLSRALTGLVSGVTASDPLTFVSAAGVLLAVALLGSYLPARKASRLDPSRALRVD